MAARKGRITVKLIGELGAGELAWDDQLPGFGARRAGGFVSFIYNYRVRSTGKMKRVVIGRDNEMSPSEARDRAIAFAADVRKGEDPALSSATPSARAKTGNTLGQAIEAWLAFPGHGWAAKTLADYKSAMGKITADEAVASKLLSDVSREDFMPIIDTTRARSPSAAAMLYRVLGSFLQFQDDRGAMSITLPKARRVAPAVPPRERAMTDEEIKALWHAAASLTPLTAAAGRLVLLTAQRSGAVVKLRRGWVTDKGKAIEFPASVMKASRAHKVPLGATAAEIVGMAIQEPEDADHIFGIGGERLKQALPGWRKAAGVDPGLKLHDLRRTLRTWAAEHGYPDVVAEAAIAHQVAKDPLAKAYQKHSYEREAGELLLAWQTYVADVVG